MAILKKMEIIHAKSKAGGKGVVHIQPLLTPDELDGKCDLYAKVTIPPGCSIGTHKHEGNTETYHILQGEARYNDNGHQVLIKTGATTFCPDGESHGIENASPYKDLIFMALILKK